MTPKDHPILLAAENFVTNYAGTDQINWMGDDLANLLGCPYLPYSNSWDDYDADADAVIPAFNNEDIDIVFECIPRVLDLAVNSCDRDNTVTVTSLLAGIDRHKLWSRFLGNEQTTYTLALAILIYLETYSSVYSLDIKIAPAIREILNVWIAPTQPWVSLPSADIVAQRLFGDAWNLFADTMDNDGNKRMLGLVASSERPPFLQGICPSQEQIKSAPLPDLGLAS